MVKKTAKYVLNKFNLYSLYSLRRSGSLNDDGWFKSFKEKSSIDKNGEPIPWLTYPCIEFLSKRVRSDLSVFEYGCGNSTLWWANRVKEVISCEHDKEWCQKIIKRAPSNVEVVNIDLEYGGKYASKLKDYYQRFDIIVIDGRDRVNCAINSITALKENGVIIWDNSDRLSYKEGFDHLLSRGFRKIEFVGMSPITSNKSETGIFYRSGNCLNI